MKNKLLLALFILLQAISSFAQTEVGGIISADETWTKANSPYLIKTNISVDTGITLTIEPGVTIQFNRNTFLTAENGVIIAEGTKTDSITFMKRNGYIGESGICLSGISKPHTFNYCRFDSIGGLSIKTQIKGSALTVKNSLFTNCETGILIDSIDKILIDSCHFVYCTSILNHVANDLKIDNCMFIGEGLTYATRNLLVRAIDIGHRGIIRNCYFDKAYSRLRNIELLNCVFKNNVSNYCVTSEGGNKMNNIHLESNRLGIMTLGDTITNSSFKHNDFSLYVEKNTYIENNIFQQNNLVITTVFDSAHKFCIKRNIFIENSEVGAIYGGTFTENIVENNKLGLLINYKNTIGGVFTCNKICNNEEDNVRVILKVSAYGYNKTIDLSNNYWCTSDTNEIKKGIRDSKKDPKFIDVVLMPIDLSECYKGTPTQLYAVVQNTIAIYPNPAGNTVTLDNLTPGSRLSFYSIEGRLLQDQIVKEEKYSMVTADLVSGLYLINILSPDGKRLSVKFVKN